ncbi:hypothetical protein EDD16DRAFT_1695428 [Pisolithus croceorrhizus]|nr:hypothetical protein EDD16DRAFT_1695428 [Pisolithus croceorrhizus]
MPSTAIIDCETLFPAPSLPPSVLSPQRLPGTSVESLAALQYVLKDNHKRWHIFHNDLKQHNHIAHRALALYALGGSGPLIRGFYEQDSGEQLPPIEPPEAITSTNFLDHLGDERYYKAYITFFGQEINEKGIPVVLEQYIFSDRFQYQEGASDQPEMLSRFIEHVKISTETQPGTSGLALAAVQDLFGNEFYPKHFFTEGAQVTTEVAAHLVSSLTLGGADTHVFDIIARIVRDDILKVDNGPQAVAQHAARIRAYATQKGEIERKMEELIWLSSAVYAIGAFDEVKGFAADFYLMHVVTSSLFLPSLITSLTPGSQVLLLRAYLVVVLTWWVARGRPDLNIKSFMVSTSTRLTSPASKGNDSSVCPNEHPNPFLPIIQTSILHPDNHLAKLQRSFAHFSTVYGNRPAGYHKGTELEGAELLDGSLFVRAALLTANYMGSKEEPNSWSRGGFFS